MPAAYTVKVYDDDEGEDLGVYESPYLPRVGDDFILWHPRVCASEHNPFIGTVNKVTHEARPGVDGAPGLVETIVWLVEEYAPAMLYCDCSPEDRARHGVEDGHCTNCNGSRIA